MTNATFLFPKVNVTVEPCLRNHIAPVAAPHLSLHGGCICSQGWCADGMPNLEGCKVPIVLDWNVLDSQGMRRNGLLQDLTLCDDEVDRVGLSGGSI
jgi:hypothetical protein